ncbi:hypothetical protein ABZ618_04060 [Streptomyces roseolus]|uniref:hypothetical protein n=1 Tax=Streptomyces roseolus TaxID=67358 RepID=UPI0033FC694A
MNTTKRVLAAVAFAGAALSLSGAAQAAPAAPDDTHASDMQLVEDMTELLATVDAAPTSMTLNKVSEHLMRAMNTAMGSGIAEIAASSRGALD